MSTRQVDNSAVTSTSTDNNGSAIYGLRTDRNNAKAVTLGDSRPDLNGSRITVAMGAVTSGVAGAVAVNNDRGVILQVTETLANGTATDPAGFLKSAGQDKFDSTLHKSESNTITNRTTRLREGAWNPFSGVFGATAANEGTLSNVTMAFGADSGVLTSGPTYQFGSNVPKQDDYEAPTT
tara:strand:- start:4379 stop:4918 length:540 start_codon:yes stop_codon:yes gene_type:complete